MLKEKRFRELYGSLRNASKSRTLRSNTKSRTPGKYIGVLECTHLRGRTGSEMKDEVLDTWISDVDYFLLSDYSLVY